jgi:hypothetical protein
MGRTLWQRQLTGCRRRLPLRQATSCSRSVHLSHAKVGFCDFLQSLFAVTCHSSWSAMQAILPILAPSLYFTDGGDDNNDGGVGGNSNDNAGRIAEALLLLVVGKYSIQVSRMWRVFYLDYLYHDTPLVVEENSHHLHNFPWQNIWFDSWTSKECFFYMSFRKNQLLWIYRQFGLAQLAAQNHRSILVFMGFRYYHFNPEELFLFMMTRCKLGNANTALCKLIFGGNASWWSFKYLWILKYLDERYDRTISHKKLRDYTDDFPLFYQAINHFIKKTSLRHFHDSTAVERQVLSFLLWSIFRFIDCSIDWINQPMPGPNGEYDGAPCKALGDVAQRAVYTGYKKGTN